MKKQKLHVAVYYKIGLTLKLNLILVLIFSTFQMLFSQEDLPTSVDVEFDLFDELDVITTKENGDVLASFKSTRLILAQSTERVKKQQLHFRISHVFSKIKGLDNLYGLDHLNNMHISFEYGLTDYIQLGLIRSNKPDKTYSTAIKLSLLRQKIDGSIPISFSYYGSVDYKSRKYVPKERNDYFSGRLDYVNQFLISRKFSSNLSIQISPTWVHRNLTDTNEEPNNIFATGIGGRYLISRSTSLNIEYFYTAPTSKAIDTKKNLLSIGFDIETGGHVFQLYFTNAFALHPGKFAINQNGDFFNGDINFGFSILREFNL